MHKIWNLKCSINIYMCVCAFINLIISQFKLCFDGISAILFIESTRDPQLAEATGE